jgi:hypothetical protein
MTKRTWQAVRGAGHFQVLAFLMPGRYGILCATGALGIQEWRNMGRLYMIRYDMIYPMSFLWIVCPNPHPPLCIYIYIYYTPIHHVNRIKMCWEMILCAWVSFFFQTLHRHRFVIVELLPGTNIGWSVALPRLSESTITTKKEETHIVELNHKFSRMSFWYSPFWGLLQSHFLRHVLLPSPASSWKSHVRRAE